MNKGFAILIIAGLGTILAPVSAHAGRIAFDRSGNLFVTDKGSDSILKFTPDGKKSTFATGISFHGAAFDGAGDVFAADGNTIFKFTPDGKKSTFASGLVPDTWDLALDRSGNLFVTDKGSYSPLKLTPDGKESTFASGLAPEDLAFDDKGNLFVTDNGSDSILKFTPEGKKSTFARERIGSYGMALDAAGNLFVLDLQSASILKFTPDGTRSTFAQLVSSTSPDKKWEHVAGDEPKIVKAGTNEVALDLEGIGGVLWAADSKRFACYSGGGDAGTRLHSINCAATSGKS